MPSNASRSRHALAALQVNTGNAQEVKADPESAVVDMIVNLLHFCDGKGLDFARCEDVARRHYREELAANSVRRLSTPGRKRKPETAADNLARHRFNRKETW